MHRQVYGYTRDLGNAGYEMEVEDRNSKIKVLMTQFPDTYEFQQDDGSWSSVPDGWMEVLDTLPPNTQTVLQSHGFDYSVMSDNEKNLSQMNIATCKLRPIRVVPTLENDLKEYATKYGHEAGVWIEIAFSKTETIPRFQVVSPRFKPLTGHVVQGGGICLEELYMWNGKKNITEILANIGRVFVQGGGRIDMTSSYKYEEAECGVGIERMKATHGWNKRKREF